MVGVQVRQCLVNRDAGAKLDHEVVLVVVEDLVAGGASYMEGFNELLGEPAYQLCFVVVGAHWHVEV